MIQVAYRNWFMPFFFKLLTLIVKLLASYYYMLFLLLLKNKILQCVILNFLKKLYKFWMLAKAKQAIPPLLPQESYLVYQCYINKVQKILDYLEKNLKKICWMKNKNIWRYFQQCLKIWINNLRHMHLLKTNSSFQHKNFSFKI